MRLGSKFIKNILAVVVFLSIGSSLAHAESYEDKDFLTPASYVEFLNQQIETGDTAAKEVLEKFMDLDAASQEAFVKFLTSDQYGESLELSGINGDDVKKSYVIDGVVVPVTVENEAVVTASENGNVSTLANTRASASRSTKLSVFGIEVSTLTLTVSWEHNGSVATKPLQVSYAHANSNPAWIITEQSSNNPGYISEGYYYGSGTWRMSATGTIGALSSTLGLNIKASTPLHRYYNFTSSHPNMNNVPWTKF
ncbi:hypothetical protein NYE54_21370 [Paenibacillus sp. FSL K6-1330]|uniref:hypothetical protein n=1 Tax=Paenibacillus sp. FSL K6-1330 TaxID=2975292 RepID=UPI0030DAD77B